MSKVVKNMNQKYNHHETEIKSKYNILVFKYI